MSNNNQNGDYWRFTSACNLADDTKLGGSVNYEEDAMRDIDHLRE